MSDRELVRFDAGQFQRMDMLVNTAINALWEINNHLKPLEKLAQGDSLQVLTAINNLSRKVDEFMSTQEERLRGVKTKLDAIQSGVDKIQQQLADLKANNPELEDEISAIEATASAIDTDVNPVVTPAPDTGTGGTTGDGGVVTGDEGGATPSGRR